MNKLPNPAALKDLKLLSQLPSYMKAEKFVRGEKIHSLVASSSGCNTAVLRAHVCAHAGGVPGLQGLMLEGSAVQNLETWEWTPETLEQYPSLSCCQVFCHPEGDSGSLKGWRFQHILTSSNLASEAAPTFNSQKFLIYYPTIAPFASFPQWEYENITWL